MGSAKTGFLVSWSPLQGKMLQVGKTIQQLKSGCAGYLWILALFAPTQVHRDWYYHSITMDAFIPARYTIQENEHTPRGQTTK